MTLLKDKIQEGLDEGRILILGIQILLGFLYRAAFEPGYAHLSPLAQNFLLGALVLVVLVFGLLMAPVAFHRVVERGEDSIPCYDFIQTMMKLTLFPFALALGLTVYVPVEKITGTAAARAIALITTSVSLFCWYGLGLFRKGKGTGSDASSPKIVNGEHKSMKDEIEESQGEHTQLKEKVRHVLTEARMVLPGAQALLGFQFITVFLEEFDKLPASSKQVHLVSLLLIAITTILLMTPAAYHRLVEKGENTERFHRFASHIVLAAMVPLGLGICGDFLVVVRKVTDSLTLAIVGAGVLLAFFYGLWFGYTWYRRSQVRLATDGHGS